MISVVIPALDERDSIVDSIERVRVVLNKDKTMIPYEIIVVDDGSGIAPAHSRQRRGRRSSIIRTISAMDAR
jgi:hypothetical protein